MIHPIDPQRDVARKFPLLGKLPPAVIDHFCSLFPPVRLSHIVGIRSQATGQEIEGWLIACPLTPRRFMEVPLSTAYRKLVQTGRLAERLGASILGLGAFASVVGDAGLTVSQRLSIPVTTGNSYTVALAVEGALAAAKRLDIDPAGSVAAVVGAYGSTGRACARLLARYVSHLFLVGRDPARLLEVKQQIEGTGDPAWSPARVSATTRLDDLRQADIVLTATSAVDPIIHPAHLKPGAVVCDVARPRNVSHCVARQRDDVLVIDGGVVDVPGNVDFGFDFGFPPGKAYACMAETMLLALEGRYECYSLGRDISLDRVDEISNMAARHGFLLSGFRTFERVLTDAEIDQVRRTVRLRKSGSRTTSDRRLQGGHTAQPGLEHAIAPEAILRRRPTNGGSS